MEKSLKVVEKTTGKGFGDARNPLLVSVRSGAKFSMPGMMDTVLNLGLNSATLEGLASLTKDRRFALDAHRRFIQLFSKIVLGIDGQLFEEALDAIKKRKKAKTDADLKAPALEELITEYRAIVKRHSRTGFPEDPMEQLRAAIGAVFESWNNKRATDYRNYNRIPHDLGTAVNVQSMVFGNMGDNSGTGVAFTRDPSTGERKLYGEYLTNAQGEDVVAGIRTPKPIAAMATDLPKAYRQFEQIARKLEKHYRDVQDMEFTIERGKLYMLQTRSGKRTAEAAVKIAVDMVRERLITRREAVLRVRTGTGRSAPPSTHRPEGESACARNRTRRLTRRRLRQGGLRCGPSRGDGEERRKGDPRAHRDQSRRRARDDRRRRGAHVARRAHLARGRGRQRYGQALCRRSGVRPGRPGQALLHRRRHEDQGGRALHDRWFHGKRDRGPGGDVGRRDLRGARGVAPLGGLVPPSRGVGQRRLPA